MGHPFRINRQAIGVLIAYFLIYVVWGSTYYVIGLALQGFPPFLLGALRFSAAGLLLLGLCAVRGERVFRWELVRKSAVSGIVLLFVDMAVIMLAEQYVSSSLVAIVASSTALWIFALDRPMWKTNFRSPLKITGVIVGFGGVLSLYAEQALSEEAPVQSEYGLLILTAGCVSWALGTLYAKYRSSKTEEVNAFGGSAWQMLAAGGMFWVWSLALGEPGRISLGEIPVGAWWSLAYLVAFGSILAYSAYVWLLKVRPAAEVGTHAYVNPFVAVFLGSVFGGEHITWLQITGLVVILCGVVFISRQAKT